MTFDSTCRQGRAAEVSAGGVRGGGDAEPAGETHRVAVRRLHLLCELGQLDAVALDVVVDVALELADVLGPVLAERVQDHLLGRHRVRLRVGVEAQRLAEIGQERRRDVGDRVEGCLLAAWSGGQDRTDGSVPGEGRVRRSENAPSKPACASIVPANSCKLSIACTVDTSGRPARSADGSTGRRRRRSASSRRASRTVSGSSSSAISASSSADEDGSGKSPPRLVGDASPSPAPSSADSLACSRWTFCRAVMFWKTWAESEAGKAAASAATGAASGGSVEDGIVGDGGG